MAQGPSQKLGARDNPSAGQSENGQRARDTAVPAAYGQEQTSQTCTARCSLTGLRLSERSRPKIILSG